MLKARVTCLLMLIALILSFTAQGATGAQPVKASDYPALSDKEIGYLRWIVKLAQQLPGDWSYMGGREEGQETMESYRYQLAFMTYALALAQYHKTPAYRELYQKSMDSLIKKMTRQDVWAFWAESSKGGKKLNPDLKERGPGWVDPVVDKNIMYSGHLIHMVELYHMLYGDTKYDKPGSLVFKWVATFEPVHTFEYDSGKLANVIYRQFKDNPWHSIECEVNWIFPPCNQHPILGLMLYDHNHGTNLADVRNMYKAAFLEKRYLDPETHHFIAFYMLQQNQRIPVINAAVDGWPGAFMHAWDPRFVEQQYPYQAKDIVKWQPDGTAGVIPDAAGDTLGVPLFALYAKEVGDVKTAKGILAWMDKNWTPTWSEGMFRYPRNDERKVTPLVTIIAATSELNVKDGLWALHNKPLKGDYFTEPFISGVEYPKAVVKQAYYDKSKDLLIVTLEPGIKATGKTTFTVNQLEKTKVYSVRKDGKLIGYVKKGTVIPSKGLKGLELNIDGGLTVSTDLNKPQSFLIQAGG